MKTKKKKELLIIRDYYTPKKEMENKLDEFLKLENLTIEDGEYGINQFLVDSNNNKLAKIRWCEEHLHFNIKNEIKDKMIELFKKFTEEKEVCVVVDIE